MTRLERYQQLIFDLVKARGDAGGELPDEEESRRVAELDDVFNAMSKDEQDECERVSP